MRDSGEAIGRPGQFPYTRGIHPTMYQERLWTMRQYAGFGDARSSNERYKYLLAHGQTGLSVAFDLPTQMGYDSDNAIARGEVGKVGVAIDHLGDMHTLMADLPLDQVSTSMTINSTAGTLLALYVAVARSRGIDPGALRGTIQNDLLKEYIARGTYIYPPRASMRLTTDIFAWCRTSVPRWNTISISGYHIREAGSTAAQEIAFTLADGIAYVEAAIAAGLGVDDVGPNLSFFFNAHNDFVEEIAKFRAARRMWAYIMRERFGAKDKRSLMMRFHTQTAGSTLTAQQPDNNVVRVAIQAMAAVLGGTQSLHTNSRDEALALPSESSARLALRTQQVIAYESGVAKHVDPFGGSLVMERETDRLEDEAMSLIREIDAMGGMVAAIERGFPQREIQNSAYAHQLGVESTDPTKKITVVGVNDFISDDAEQTGLLRMSADLETEQIARLAVWRAGRDGDAVAGALDALGDAATGTANVMPAILAAVEAKATLGEVADVLRRVFGRYRESVVV
ncbi:MAG: methylmalonyl-CoA mutase [Myxococcales bacterium]|nr:methylmalonyl-CoA mutase [Myxococcales bacterium]